MQDVADFVKCTGCSQDVFDCGLKSGRCHHCQIEDEGVGPGWRPGRWGKAEKRPDMGGV